LALSCAHNVPQDSASGPDAKSKGAKPITIDNGEGKASGIVRGLSDTELENLACRKDVIKASRRDLGVMVARPLK
jgi:pseudouridine-5'-phosphate glycosidase